MRLCPIDMKRLARLLQNCNNSQKSLLLGLELRFPRHSFRSSQF